MPHKLGNVLSWASDLDGKALDQAQRASKLPFVDGHLALMPDAHFGMGATIGSVIPTRGAIIPSAVGVDIGCGMIAAELPFTSEALGDDLTPLHAGIAGVVPAGVGQGHHHDRGVNAHYPGTPAHLPDRLATKAVTQFGSLGSGNHFVELCLDERDVAWVVLHSGSRGVGNELARVHIDGAKALMKRYFVTLEDPDLAYLVEGTPEFDAYIRDMLWAQAYALGNREAMLDAVLLQVAAWVARDVEPVTRINCFAGETEVITRHGARPIASLAGGRHELLTEDGAWVKAPVQSFGRDEVMEVELSRSGVRKVIRATAGHRWLLRTRRGARYEAVTADLQPGNRLAFAFPPAPEGRSVDRAAVARGFIYGDGNWKDERPSLDSPASVLYGWLAGYFAADGEVGKTGRPSLWSASREDLEFVRLACQAVGIGTYGIRTRLRVGYGQQPSEIHVVGLMRGDLDSDFFLIPAHRERFELGRLAAERRGWNVVDVPRRGDVTEVYCAVVDGTHSFALADNILTGNCHHNYTERENHRGRNVWLTRKGAIRARVGDRGIIPGSMGTQSYIVRGLGNPASYHSCSHGAGRRMSRGEAKRVLDLDGLREQMAGRAWNESTAEALLDEDPRAYKDIDRVMEDQRDLVAVEHTLHQVLNYKGL